MGNLKPVYGWWTLLYRDPTDKRKWVCKCKCGTIKSVWISNLRDGKTLSCGCYGTKKTRERNLTHGGAKERLYQVWQNMRRRCNDPKNNRYANYGGRGIKVCKEWSDYAVFRKWAQSSGYDENAEYGKCTLERINVDGDYEPSNCTWKTIKAQCYNRTSNHTITFNGKTQTLTEWENELGFPSDRLGNRLRKGWSIERAITTPLRSRNGDRKAS